jgi:hypothetical protein
MKQKHKEGIDAAIWNLTASAEEILKNQSEIDEMFGISIPPELQVESIRQAAAEKVAGWLIGFPYDSRNWSYTQTDFVRNFLKDGKLVATKK